jgi:hypothetical protein
VRECQHRVLMSPLGEFMKQSTYAMRQARFPEIVQSWRGKRAASAAVLGARAAPVCVAPISPRFGPVTGARLERLN